MDEKSRFRQRTTISESKRHYRNTASRNSSVGSHRKQKLHGARGVVVREELMRNHQIREADQDEDKNVAGEVLQSGKNTGEFVTDSASKKVQKRRIRKKMVMAAEQKRAKETGKTASNLSGKVLSGVDDAISRIGEDAVKVVAENPIPVVCAIVLGILIIVVSVTLSSCTMVIGSFQSSAVTTTYTAEDSEILVADAYYSDLESKLQDRVDQIETDYPGYDEYVYALDDIGHDPYQLASILTVLYEDFTEDEVIGTMVGIFDVQYTITLTECEETRTKIEIKTRWEKKTRMEEREGTRIKWDESQKKFVLETYTYEVEVAYWEEVEYEEEVEYQYYILQIKLTNQGIDGVVRNLNLTEEQLQRYELLTALKGNKSYLF